MTFNFKFECDTCKFVKQRSSKALNRMFDGNIIKIITSFDCCFKCKEMYELESKYSKKEYENFNVGKKQLHCVLHHFDFNYKERTNLKHKKQYFKDIINEDTKYSKGGKQLMIKFINDTKHIKLIETYKEHWLLNYDVDVIKRFWYDEDEEFYHDVARQVARYKDILLSIFKIYFKNKTTYHFNQPYFNDKEIFKYLKSVFYST